METTRRNFLKMSGSAIAASMLPACSEAADPANSADPAEPRFEISLAQWSLHRTLRKGELSNLDFPKFTKDTFGINAVEYVNMFFKDKAKDMKYLSDLKSRTDAEGIRNVLIMCDGEGQLGAKTKAIENHYKWVTAAKFLGCHSIRVNAGGPGNAEELGKRVVDGLGQLSGFAKDFNINVIVENHGGHSSDGAWLSGVLKTVNMPNCGSLPDFGNFHQYDRYQGMKDLMPFAKGVSAKSRRFDDKGEEVETDYLKVMQIVAASPYKGYVGIEYEGGKLSELDGIIATKKLLERVFAKLA